MRTVVLLRRCQLRFRMKRRNDGYDTRQPPDFPQLPNAGHLQPVPSEPLENLVGPRLQQVLSGRLHRPRPHLADCRQPAQLLLGGGQPTLSYARALGGRDVLGNGSSRQAGAQRNLASAISSRPAFG